MRAFRAFCLSLVRVSLAVLITCASFSGGHVRAATSSALDCLEASSQDGGLAGCLGESGKDAGAAVAAGTAASRTRMAASLGVVALDGVHGFAGTAVRFESHGW